MEQTVVAAADPTPPSPPPEATAYEAMLCWEAYANGTYQKSIIRKAFTLLVQPNAAGYVADFQSASPPTLTKARDLEPLEEMALRLAALYERVVVQVTPAGEVTELLNYAELQRTWEHLSQEIRTATLENNELTETILTSVARQLQSPASFLQSLQHDYLYQTLLPDLYTQVLDGLPPTSRRRQFSNFFDKASLWFWEQADVAPDEPLTLRLHGALDAQRTDVAQIKSLIDHELRLVPAPASTPPLPARLPTPHFQYEAVYKLEPDTGLPLHVELSVYARAGELYNKQYTLTLTRP